MLSFTAHPNAPVSLSRSQVAGIIGLIPSMVSEHSALSAQQQIEHNYVHGGGWYEMKRFYTLEPDDTLMPVHGEDAPLKPLAVATLRDEKIVVYDYAIVAVIQKDRSFNVSRLD